MFNSFQPLKKHALLLCLLLFVSHCDSNLSSLIQGKKTYPAYIDTAIKATTNIRIIPYKKVPERFALMQERMYRKANTQLANVLMEQMHNYIAKTKTPFSTSLAMKTYLCHQEKFLPEELPFYQNFLHVEEKFISLAHWKSNFCYSHDLLYSTEEIATALISHDLKLSYPPPYTAEKHWFTTVFKEQNKFNPKIKKGAACWIIPSYTQSKPLTDIHISFASQVPYPSDKLIIQATKKHNLQLVLHRKNQIKGVYFHLFYFKQKNNPHLDPTDLTLAYQKDKAKQPLCSLTYHPKQFHTNIDKSDFYDKKSGAIRIPQQHKRYQDIDKSCQAQRDAGMQNKTLTQPIVRYLEQHNLIPIYAPGDPTQLLGFKSCYFHTSNRYTKL